MKSLFIQLFERKASAGFKDSYKSNPKPAMTRINFPWDSMCSWWTCTQISEGTEMAPKFLVLDHNGLLHRKLCDHVIDRLLHTSERMQPGPVGKSWGPWVVILLSDLRQQLRCLLTAL